MGEEMTPKEYFEILKSKKHNITDEDLLKAYNNSITLAQKYIATGQIKGLRKLIYHIENIKREREIVKLGINTFVYRDDIEEYIDTVAKNTVKVIELENYEREIPDDVAKVIVQVRAKFNQMYVIFTDYTGAVERQIKREERETDPIVFGTFQDRKSHNIIDRFYFIGDWVDDKCDLTLDKMVDEMKAATNKDILRNISTPTTVKELEEQLATMERKESGYIMDAAGSKKNNKNSLFNRVRTFLRVGEK